MVLFDFGVFGLALFFLVKSSDFFVEAAARLAKRFKISELVIGITIIAIGTSLPELTTSVLASASGNSGISVGNVVGSNIANIGLILGFAAIFSTIKVGAVAFRRDAIFLFLVSLLFLLFASDGLIDSTDSFVLLLFFTFYITYLIGVLPGLTRRLHFRDFLAGNKHLNNVFGFDVHEEDYMEGQRETELKSSLMMDIMIIILSAVGILYGAKYLVSSAVNIALFFSVPDSFIALTMVSIGTSLPEFSVAASCASRGLGNMILGNVIGSNIANTLLVTGLSGLANPLNISNVTINYTLPYMLVFTFFMLFLMRSDWNLTKKEGIFFLSLYALFLGVFTFVMYW